METTTAGNGERWARAGFWLAVTAGLVLVLYAAVVVMASLGFRYGWRPPIELTSVQEFLLVGAISVLAITAALCREKARAQNAENTTG